jgi:chromosome segregation ATPase
MGFIPPTSDLQSLLALLNDPAAAKKRLAELAEREKAFAASADENRELLRKLASERAAHGKEKDEALAEVERRRAEIAPSLAELDQRERAIKEREDRFRRAEARLVELEATIGERQKTLREINRQFDDLRERLR